LISTQISHADGAAHSDADACPDARADARTRAGADAAADARAVFRTVVKPVAAAYDQPNPRARARTYINTVATAVVGTRPGADVRPDRATFWSTHLKALSKALGAPDDCATHDLESDGRADAPSFRTTVLTPRTRAHAQADGVTDAHGGPDAAGPLLRLRPDPDGPAPLLFKSGCHLRPEHRRDL